MYLMPHYVPPKHVTCIDKTFKNFLWLMATGV